MGKQLLIKPEKCLGCRTCELVCSFGHNGAFNPRFANVSVMAYEEAAISVPMMCMQCEEPCCMEVCPVGAIFRDEKDAVIINPDKCIGCKMCMNACPLGNIGFNTERRQVHKCDLCGGDPKCAKFCPTGAISYEDPEEGIDRKRAIADQARTIRIPVHMVETINKLIRVSRQLLQELGREPTPEEIAEEMKMPVDRVREILKISQEPVSLETPIGEEEDSHLGDFIQDDNVPVPADAAAFTLLKEQLIEVLGTLTEREQKVLRLRFGLDDGRARTLEEVGKEFNVTRERIRQIEAKALRKLRHPSRSRKLKDYLD